MTLHMYHNYFSPQFIVYRAVVTALRDGDLHVFKELAQDVNFFPAAYENGLLLMACRAGEKGRDFVNLLLTFDAVRTELSKNPEILFETMLDEGVFQSLIKCLQEDFVHKNNYHFVEWLQSQGRQEEAEDFKRAARGEGNMQVDFPSHKRPREETLAGIEEPPAKKCRV